MMSVSVALRDMPGVSEKTRLAVKACAKKLGYRPDPRMSALADYRRHVRSDASYPELAFVTDQPIPSGPAGSYVNGLLDGARKRGRDYGYKVVPFCLGEESMAGKQAGSVLLNRGIRGVLMAPPTTAGGGPDGFGWKYFAAVDIEPPLAGLRLDYAAYDHHRAVRTVLEKLRERGYRRIGLALPERRSACYRHLPLDAFYGDQLRHRDGPMLEAFCPAVFSEAAFWRWHEEHAPDVVVTDAPDLVLALLRKRGLRVPQDIGVACFCGLAAGRGTPVVSGVLLDPPAIGAAAVDRLHTNLLRNVYGLPGRPNGTLTPGRWCEGTTLLKRRS